MTRTARSSDSPESFEKWRRTPELVHTQVYDPGDLGDSMGQEGAMVTVAFDETDGVTSVTTTIKFASKEDRDAAFSTGMTDGMEMGYQRLDQVLAPRPWHAAS